MQWHKRGGSVDPKVKEAIVVAAVKRRVPPAILGALFYAESGLKPDAERWYTRTQDAQAAIEARNWQVLGEILQGIYNANSDDISFGLDQRTWRWSEEFQRARETTGKSIDDLRKDTQLIMTYRGVSFDPQYAAERGAKMFAPLYEQYGVPEALYRYNKPNGTATKAVKARYDMALEWARGQDWRITVVAEFGFETEGFANKADELGVGVVGEPIEAEHSLGKDYIVQFTTTGAMVYVRSLNANYFFAAAR